MKKIFYFLFALLLLSATSMNAQVAIGSQSDPRPGAILDLQGDGTTGLLLPKVTLTSTKSWAPVVGTTADEVDGMMVYNDNTSTFNGLDGKGVYVWINLRWNKISPSAVVPDPDSPFIQDDPEAVSICFGSTTKFTLAAASGGAGIITYNWQQSLTGADGSWVDAAGTHNEVDYTTPTLTTDMYYRRLATAATRGGTIESHSALVTVYEAFTQPNPANTSACYGGTTTITLAAASGGSDDITYNWEQSMDNITWVDAVGTRGEASYTTPSLYDGTYYRRQAICTCNTIASARAYVTVTMPNGTPVTGKSGFTYSTYSYPNQLGIWTTNVKESGFDKDTYAGHARGERGYYYSYTKAGSACAELGTGWSVPSSGQWSKLITYLTGTKATFAEKSFFTCGDAQPGLYNYSLGTWVLWDKYAYWWSGLGTNRMVGISASGTWEQDRENLMQDVVSVRCVKSN